MDQARDGCIGVRVSAKVNRTSWPSTDSDAMNPGTVGFIPWTDLCGRAGPEGRSRRSSHLRGVGSRGSSSAAETRHPRRTRRVPIRAGWASTWGNIERTAPAAAGSIRRRAGIAPASAEATLPQSTRSEMHSIRRVVPMSGAIKGSTTSATKPSALARCPSIHRPVSLSTRGASDPSRSSHHQRSSGSGWALPR